MSETLSHFKTVFNQLNAGNLERLAEIYSTDVEFRDPVHELHGLDDLRSYYARLYEGVVSCRFEFEDELVTDGHAALVWVMHFEHARFRKGETLSLRGVSHLSFHDTVYRHHDYFDMGAFIYEKVPLLGSVIRSIKRRL